MKRDFTRRELLKLGGGTMAGGLLLGTGSAVLAQPNDRARERAQGFPVRGPVIFTTAEMIERARRRIAEEQEPFYTAWLRTEAAADAALPLEFAPYNGGSHSIYFQTARSQAVDARGLGLAYRLTGSEAYLSKARQILLDWAADAKENPNPASDRLPPAGSPQGLVIGRAISIFADAYALIYHELSAQDRQEITEWFQLMVEPILWSQNFWVEGENLDAGLTAPYLGQQYFNNHLGAQTMGLAAIGFATNDRQLINYALRSPRNPRDLETLIDGVILMPGDEVYKEDPTLTDGAPEPEPGEGYDRYRTTGGSGLHYTHIHLRFITLMAEMAYNNRAGRDYFDYVGPNGENLRVSFELYADYLITGDPSARTGYYSESYVDFTLLPLYEIAARHYPESEKIREVLESRSRLLYDFQHFARTAVLTHGPDDLDIAPVEAGLGERAFEFNRNGDFYGWTLEQDLTGEVKSGAMRLSVIGPEPVLLSPDGELGFDASEYSNLRIRLLNRTEAQEVRVAFETLDDSGQVDFDVSSRDAEYGVYDVDLSSSEAWSGAVEQIRIEMEVPSASGELRVDYIRIS